MLGFSNLFIALSIPQYVLEVLPAAVDTLFLVANHPSTTSPTDSLPFFYIKFNPRWHPNTDRLSFPLPVCQSSTGVKGQLFRSLLQRAKGLVRHTLHRHPD